jgi:hypothetical protein
VLTHSVMRVPETNFGTNNQDRPTRWRDKTCGHGFSRRNLQGQAGGLLGLKQQRLTIASGAGFGGAGLKQQRLTGRTTACPCRFRRKKPWPPAGDGPAADRFARAGFWASSSSG